MQNNITYLTVYYDVGLAAAATFHLPGKCFIHTPKLAGAGQVRSQRICDSMALLE